MSENILILDFDGVVCDGLNECLLSAWNTWHGLDVAAFDAATLENIPSIFMARFAHYRNFVRHSGQFVMPFLLDFEGFASGEDFDRAFSSIPTQSVDNFVARFEEYRVGVISNRYDSWIRMHAYYDGIPGVLRNNADSIFIVSGKDEHSIVQILRSQDLHVPESQIFGSMRTKVPALMEIAGDLGCAVDHMHFYDDNLANVVEAREAGFSAHWAGWGYKTENDIRTAEVLGVPQVGLDAFVAQFG